MLAPQVERITRNTLSFLGELSDHSKMGGDYCWSKEVKWYFWNGLW